MPSFILLFLLFLVNLFSNALGVSKRSDTRAWFGSSRQAVSVSQTAQEIKAFRFTEMRP
ncbi:hypothetical protein LEP1GSC108_4503 [Leptospira weilii str. UI 13098]|uniref:Uncharacterized protein n=1 Tax=Leptospira weilii str. UI 13098 TaxID=1088542 RepID=M6Q192_9LEPT|nr:hypothetical protein LEP1GSC108_4503 [Leptospira weilii str. UI 13098]